MKVVWLRVSHKVVLLQELCNSLSADLWAPVRRKRGHLGKTHEARYVDCKPHKHESADQVSPSIRSLVVQREKRLKNVLFARIPYAVPSHYERSQHPILSFLA